MSQADKKNKDAERLGFNHHPAIWNELINSTAEPMIHRADRDHLASKAELMHYEGYLKFPNIHLERYYLFYEKFKSSPMNKEKYQEYVAKMSQLYGYITAAEENLEEWFRWITVAENEKFIKMNVEYRLSQDLSNKKLWMMYIQYLKEDNPKEMLQIYSKYCRYFQDDIDMVKKYWAATKIHGPAYVNFDKLFDFEKSGAEKLQCGMQQMQIKEPKPLKIFFTPNNAQNQEFPFKAPLMNYILQKANGTVLTKLHQTCKYFFIKRPIFPCYRFVLKKTRLFDNGQKYTYSENSMHYISDMIPEPNEEKDLIISTSLFANHEVDSMLSMFIKRKFYQCDAKHFEIKNQRLTEKELNFLVGHGNVESFWLNNVVIHDDAGELMLIEKILQKMPKLRDFRSVFMPLTNESIEKLQHLDFNNKFLCFAVCNIDNADIDVQAFYNFIVKNAAPVSTFIITFASFIAPFVVDNFRNNLMQIIHGQWNLEQQKPKILVSRNDLMLPQF